MALTVGELVGYLSLDTTKFDRALARAKKKFNELQDGAKRSASTLGKLTATAAAAGGAFSAMAAGTATATAALLVLPGAAAAGGAAMATLNVAMSGFGEALSNIGDPKKFAESVAELAPAAAATAREVRALNPEWQNLADGVQQVAFGGMADHVADLGGTYLPMLQTAMGGVAQQFNNGADAIAAWLGKAATVSDIEGVFTSTRIAVGNLMDTLAPLAQVFTDLAAVGSDVLAGMTVGAGEAAQKFADMVSKARAAGQLEQWMRSGLDALSQLATIVGNLGEGLVGMFRAAAGPGDQLLSQIVTLTEQFATWANSAQGQQQLADAFTLLSQVSGHLLAVLPIVADVASTLVGWFGQLPAPVQSSVAQLLAMSLVIGTVTAKFWPLISGIGKLSGKFLKAATTQGTFTRRMLTGFGKASAAAVKGAGKVSWAVLKIVGRLVFMAGAAMARAVIMAASWLIAMGPIGWIIAAVVGLVALVIANWDRVKAWTIAAWKAVSAWVAKAWQWIVDAVKAAGRWVVDLVSNAWQWAKDSAVSAGQGMVDWVTGLPGMILSALGNLGSLLVDSGRALLEGLWEGVSGAVGWVKGKISGALGAIRNLFPFSPAKEGPFSGSGYTSHSGRALIEDFGRAIEASGGNAASAANRVTGRVQSALSSAGPPRLAAQGAAHGAGAGASGPGGRGGAVPVVRIEMAGNDAMKRLIRKIVRVDGRGDVQVALGS